MDASAPSECPFCRAAGPLSFEQILSGERLVMFAWRCGRCTRRWPAERRQDSTQITIDLAPPRPAHSRLPWHEDDESPAPVASAAPNRRNPAGQEAMAGGERRSDPPLIGDNHALYSANECAGWIGVSPRYIVNCINGGHLRAERFNLPGQRPIYRVHHDDFVSFLGAIGFKKVPKPRAAVPSPGAS